jgi:hypothetical protein
MIPPAGIPDGWIDQGIIDTQRPVSPLLASDSLIQATIIDRIVEVILPTNNGHGDIQSQAPAAFRSCRGHYTGEQEQELIDRCASVTGTDHKHFPSITDRQGGHGYRRNYAHSSISSMTAMAFSRPCSTDPLHTWDCVYSKRHLEVPRLTASVNGLSVRYAENALTS